MKIIRITSLLFFLVLLLSAQRMDAQCNIVLDAVVTNESCFGMQDGSIDLTITGGTLPIYIEWSSGASSEDIFNLVAGTYTVTATDDLGCQVTLTREVTGPPDVLFSYLNDDGIITCNNPTAEVTATATGGIEPYVFVWSNGTNGNVLSTNIAESYTVTVTDANGCTVTSETTVEMSPTFPIADAGPDQILISCATAPNLIGGGNTTIGPDFTYEWTTFTGEFEYGTDVHQPIIEVTSFGFYMFKVTSLVEGCFAFDMIGVFADNSFPVVNIPQPPKLSCVNTQVVIECPNCSTGPEYSYQWSTTNGYIVSGETTLNLTVDAPGFYLLEITNTNLGCKKARGVVVEESFVVDAGPDQGLPCGNGQVTLSGTAPIQPPGQFSYLWSTANGHIVSGANTLNPVVDQAGIYLLTVFDTNTGCTKTDEVAVLPGTLVLAQNLSVLDVSCTGQLGGIWLNMSQGQQPYDYLWSDGSQQQNLINIATGTYTATITDATGCQFYASAEVKDTSTITVDLAVTQPTCQNPNGGAIDLTVTGLFGPFDYQWNTGDTAQDISGLGEGPHIVTITYAFGTCSEEHSVILSTGSSFSLTTDITPASCTNQNDGAIDLSVNGQIQAPLQYFWSTGAATQDIQNLLSGNYTVTVQDGTGCTASTSANVKLGYELSITGSVTNATCAGACTGAVDVTVAAGLSPFSFVWSTGETTQDLLMHCAGNYTVTVSDAAGCTESYAFTIQTAPSGISAQLTVTDATCNGNDGAIDLSVSGGQPPYAYDWSTGPNNPQDLQNLFAGMYTVTVTDAEGCTQTASGTVGQISAMSLSTTIQDASCTGGCDGSIDLTVIGSGPFNYFWSNGVSLEDLSSLCSGNYTVTVEDALGCTKPLTVTIQDNSSLDITGLVSQVSCAGSNTGAIDLTVTGGTPGYTFLWSQGSSTEDIGNLSAGVYTVTVTDQLGCTQTANFQVTGSAALQLSVDVSPNICFGSTQGFVQLTTSGGTPNFQFDWEHLPGNTDPEDLNSLSAGTYTVTVTDANGCTQTATATINQSAALQITELVVHPLCAGSSTGDINITVSGGTVPYAYAWTTVPGGAIITNTEDLNDFPAGTYQVAVTDALGCTASATYTLIDPAPVQFSIQSLSNNCVEETLSGPTWPGATYAWTGPNNFTAITQVITVSTPGAYTLVVTDNNGCTATAQYMVNLLLSGSCGAIQGRLFYDTDESCNLNNNEGGLAGWIVRAEGAADTLYSVSDADGQYKIDVPLGVYAIKVLVPNGLWGICTNAVPVEISAAGQIVAGGDFAAQAQFTCPALEASLGVDKLRRCFDNNFYQIQYCNKGTQKATDAFVNVALDPFLTPVGASMPYTDLGSNVLRFEVGDVAVGDCGQISVQVFVNCNAVLGQTHCTEATIYPDTFCMPPGAGWSGASLQVSSICQPDSLRFIITNQGTGLMSNSSGYIVVEDGVMFRAGTLNPLGPDETMEIVVPANGSTWRLELDQEQNHPLTERVGLSVEGCTASASFSTGFTNQFPQSDEGPALDRNCTQNKGSFDPNDKHSDPIGYGADHYVRPGTEIDYKIRFQNTGTDTAFTVRILDTLSSWLDPSSIRFGASSHPYVYDLTGEGVVHFNFYGIALPDSNTNETASHGFVHFTIRHVADAPLEAVIENKAAIYFDFNEPVITNTTRLKLGDQFITVGVWQPFMPTASVLVSPNPFRSQTSLEVKGLVSGEALMLQVFDLNGKLMEQLETTSTVFPLTAGNWSPGLYGFRILQSGKLVGAGKLVVHE